MRKLLSTIAQFFAELRRRNVYKVAVTYVVVAFFTLRGARLVFPATTLEGVYDALVVFAVVGFPIALVLTWALELTPEGGVQRTGPAEREPSDGEPSEEGARRQAATSRALWVGASAVALVLVGTWWLWGGPAPGDAATSAEDRPPEVEERSVAVLPFEPLSPGQESKTFARGVHDDLLTRLSNISDLQVSPEPRSRSTAIRTSRFRLSPRAWGCGGSWRGACSRPGTRSRSTPS